MSTDSQEDSLREHFLSTDTTDTHCCNLQATIEAGKELLRAAQAGEEDKVSLHSHCFSQFLELVVEIKSVFILLVA